jgi:hypothetical protein
MGAKKNFYDKKTCGLSASFVKKTDLMEPDRLPQFSLAKVKLHFSAVLFLMTLK